MTWRVIAAAAMFAPGAAFAQSELPNFEFRDAVAGAVHEPKEFGVCLDRRDKPDSRICLRGTGNDTLAGQRMIDLAVGTYKDRLSMLMGTFDDDAGKAILEAFTAKYGEPCETHREPWQSRIGVKAENAVIVWCFKTGKLKLESIGGKLGESRFMYIDEWQAPENPPKVDF